MQFIKCGELIMGLSCAVHRQQILLNSGNGLYASYRSLLTNSLKYHGSHPRTHVQSPLRNQLCLRFQQIRRKSSLTSDANPMNNQSNRSSSEAVESGDDVVTTKHQALRDEFKQMRDLGKSVPAVISDADLEYYATLTSKSGRKKFLTFLFIKDRIKKKEKLEKLQKKLDRVKPDDEDLEETLPPNKMFRRFSGVPMLTGYNWKLASAMKFGPQIAFDFSFDEHMARPAVINMISHLTHVLNANKEAKDPFYMHWTGLKDGSMSLAEMQRMFVEFQNLMINVTKTDVLEMFPKEKLIYLTGDSKNIMHTFDVDKVYIVGGLVDLTIKTGLTLSKAKRHNISHAKFPLDLYLHWGSGGKALTLDQVARILHTLHETGDWTKALKHVPQRKHSGLKVTRTLDSRISDKISTRQDLERYYKTKKREMEVGQSRKESRIRDGSPFAFSRAKREFKWDLLPERSERAAGRGKEGTVMVDREEETQKEELDPSGDTLFSSSSELKINQKSRARKKGSK